MSDDIFTPTEAPEATTDAVEPDVVIDLTNDVTDTDEEVAVHVTDEIKGLRGKISQLEAEVSMKDKIVAELTRSIDGQKQTLAEKDDMIGSLRAVIEDSYR